MAEGEFIMIELKMYNDCSNAYDLQKIVYAAKPRERFCLIYADGFYGDIKCGAPTMLTILECMSKAYDKGLDDGWNDRDDELSS